MLSRTWDRPVSDGPPGRVRVTPATPAACGDPAWQGADDATLVSACLDGHRAAYDVIVERHRRQVYQVCYRFVGNHEDASDLAQDAFIRAYRGLHGFKAHARFSTWLYRIAVNVCLNRVGTKMPATEPIEARDRADQGHEPADESLVRRERAAHVRRAVARLPRKQRAAVILRVYHDLSHAEIANILGSSAGAVKANVFHALVSLRKLLS
jgi:RNA polymerase sigma-70 factor, ECF subfamily